MAELARQQPGFRDLVSVRGADGVGVTVATFDSEQDAVAWKRTPSTSRRSVSGASGSTSGTSSRSPR